MEDQKAFEDNLERLVAVFEKKSDGYRASAGGWVEEELSIPGNSEKAKAYVGCIGWRSVEAHMLFRETQAFKDNVHWLRGAKDLKTLNVVHVPLKEFKLGNGDVADA